VKKAQTIVVLYPFGYGGVSERILWPSPVMAGSRAPGHRFSCKVRPLLALSITLLGWHSACFSCKERRNRARMTLLRYHLYSHDVVRSQRRKRKDWEAEHVQASRKGRNFRSVSTLLSQVTLYAWWSDLPPPNGFSSGSFVIRKEPTMKTKSNFLRCLLLTAVSLFC